MNDEKKKTVPEDPQDKPAAPGSYADTPTQTWVDDMKQEMEDYIEDQGIYIRQ